MERKPSPSDVSDVEWAFVAPYLTLMTEDAPQRAHSVREGFNGRRWIVRAGAAWRMVPHDSPPWYTVDQQSMRGLNAGVFAAMVHELRAVLRLTHGRAAEPSAAICDSRTLQSTPESGTRAGYDGAKRTRGSTVPMAVDTLGHLLAWHVTPANVQERTQVVQLAGAVQHVTGDTVQSADVDQGYTGESPVQDATAHQRQLEIVKLPAATQGFVLLPRRWGVERRVAWAGRFRRVARDYERLAETLTGLHFVAFAILRCSSANTLRI